MQNGEPDISQTDTKSLLEIVTVYLRERYAGQVATTYNAAPADGSPEKTDAFDDALQEVIEGALTGSGDAVFADLVERMPQIVAEHRAERASFEARLYARWRQALDLFETALVIAEEMGADFNQQHRPQAARENDYIFEVLIRLHARACLVCSEVLALLTSGHASGANARWRTMHELAVVAFFVKEHGQDIAERYLLHDAIESAKAADLYQEHYTRLGYKPLESEEFAELQARRDALCQRFGSDYSKHYGWTATALNCRAPTFAHLEQAVSLEHLRPHYGMASHSVHAKPKGIMFDIGNATPGTLLLAGPSNAGLADPGHGALISLMQVTAALLTLKPDFREVIALKVLQRFVDEAGEAFLATHKKIEDKEQVLCDQRGTTALTEDELATIEARWKQDDRVPEAGETIEQASKDMHRLVTEVKRLIALSDGAVSARRPPRALPDELPDKARVEGRRNSEGIG